MPSKKGNSGGRKRKRSGNEEGNPSEDEDTPKRKKRKLRRSKRIKLQTARTQNTNSSQITSVPTSNPPNDDDEESEESSSENELSDGDQSSSDGESLTESKSSRDSDSKQSASDENDKTHNHNFKESEPSTQNESNERTSLLAPIKSSVLRKQSRQKKKAKPWDTEQQKRNQAHKPSKSIKKVDQIDNYDENSPIVSGNKNDRVAETPRKRSTPLSARRRNRNFKKSSSLLGPDQSNGLQQRIKPNANSPQKSKSSTSPRRDDDIFIPIPSPPANENENNENGIRSSEESHFNRMWKFLLDPLFGLFFENENHHISIPMYSLVGYFICVIICVSFITGGIIMQCLDDKAMTKQHISWSDIQSICSCDTYFANNGSTSVCQPCIDENVLLENERNECYGQKKKLIEENVQIKLALEDKKPLEIFIRSQLERCQMKRGELERMNKKCIDKRVNVNDGECEKKYKKMEHDLGECNVELAACEQTDRQNKKLHEKLHEEIKRQQDNFKTCNRALKKFKNKK